jgi:hypothetical protein
VFWSLNSGKDVRIKIDDKLVFYMSLFKGTNQPYGITLMREVSSGPTTIYFAAEGRGMKVGKIGKEGATWSHLEIRLDTTRAKV